MVNDMVTSQNGIDFIKRYEGCVLKVYLDAIGVKTLGYGHTGADVNVLPVGTQITKEQAELFLKQDLSKFESNVSRYDSVYHWTQNEFDALVSFAYNVGSIDQLTANGTRDKSVIAEKILLYNKAGGKVLAGLTNRRKAEQQMFLGGVSTIYNKGASYTLSANLYIRQEPYGEKMKYECITMDAKAHSYFDEYGCAVLKRGTRVTCLEVKSMTDSIWLMIPSGWICAKEGSKIYIA